MVHKIYVILFVCETGNRARDVMRIFKLSAQPLSGDRMRRRVIKGFRKNHEKLKKINCYTIASK